MQEEEDAILTITAARDFVHISHSALSIFVLYFCPHFGVGRLPMLNPVNSEAVPLVHTFYTFMCCLFFTLLYLSREHIRVAQGRHDGMPASRRTRE